MPSAFTGGRGVWGAAEELGHPGTSGSLFLGKRPQPALSLSWVLAHSSGWCESPALAWCRTELGRTDRPEAPAQAGRGAAGSRSKGRQQRTALVLIANNGLRCVSASSPSPERSCPVIAIINGNGGSEGKCVFETTQLESVCTAVCDLQTPHPVLLASDCRLASAGTQVSQRCCDKGGSRAGLQLEASDSQAVKWSPLARPCVPGALCPASGKALTAHSRPPASPR